MFYVTSGAIAGITSVPVTVEADLSRGLPKFSIVGLPDASVKESRDRIQAAIKNSGYRFPRGRLTINLAPADVRKQGPLYDLPIALSILVMLGVIPAQAIKGHVVVGELALDGKIRPVQGVLTVARMAQALNTYALIVPTSNAPEAAALEELRVLEAATLQEVVDHFRREHELPVATPPSGSSVFKHIDLATVKGQEGVKRGLEIAAAGNHNVLLFGPPGSGKTLLARAFPSLLPPLSLEESIEVTTIASVSGLARQEPGLISSRPFRAPHHSSSAVSLVGGGAWPKPGEVSLAHRGVLFLDELPEFSRYVLEHLRQPLEDGFVTISRATGTVEFPSRFQLIAAMNPCPCGYLTEPERSCQCSIREIQRYQKKISGPLLDRFDLVLQVPAVKEDKLLSVADGEPSTLIAKRVEAARNLQFQRFNDRIFSTNSEMSSQDLDYFCPLDSEVKTFLQTALRKNHLSARGFMRVRKVAQTIADLGAASEVSLIHVAEALQYRLSLTSTQQHL